MLPEYEVYRRLEELKQLEKQDEKRAQLEIPRHIPMWKDPEENEDQDRDKNQAGIVIINM